MSPFSKLLRFFVKVLKYYTTIAIFEGTYCKYDIKKHLAYSKPHSFRILRHKMNKKTGFEFILKKVWLFDVRIS